MQFQLCFLGTYVFVLSLNYIESNPIPLYIASTMTVKRSREGYPKIVDQESECRFRI